MKTSVTRLDYCQYLLVSQINYTLTNFADHSNKFSHDAINCGVCGIENATIDNSAAYLQSWMQVLRNDPKMLVHAAAQAQKAADYIQHIHPETGASCAPEQLSKALVPDHDVPAPQYPNPRKESGVTVYKWGL